LYPSKSLIDNIGHDGSGVHSGVNDMYKVTVNRSAITKFPERIKEEKEYFNLVKLFLKNRKGGWVQRGIRFFKQYFSKK
jgi:hypothetical protein